MLEKVALKFKRYAYQNALIWNVAKAPLSPNMGAHGNAIYHERQIRELCALHALNNLFQGNLVESIDLCFFRFFFGFSARKCI